MSFRLCVPFDAAGDRDGLKRILGMRMGMGLTMGLGLGIGLKMGIGMGLAMGTDMGLGMGNNISEFLVSSTYPTPSICPTP